MQKYLKLVLTPDSEEDLETIIDNLRTTLDREQIIDAEGDTYIEIQNDVELAQESFCLGMVFAELEEDGIASPFFVEVVELEVEPVDVGRQVN